MPRSSLAPRGRPAPPGCPGVAPGLPPSSRVASGQLRGLRAATVLSHRPSQTRPLAPFGGGAPCPPVGETGEVRSRPVLGIRSPSPGAGWAMLPLTLPAPRLPPPAPGVLGRPLGWWLHPLQHRLRLRRAFPPPLCVLPRGPRSPGLGPPPVPSQAPCPCDAPAAAQSHSEVLGLERPLRFWTHSSACDTFPRVSCWPRCGRPRGASGGGRGARVPAQSRGLRGLLLRAACGAIAFRGLCVDVTASSLLRNLHSENNCYRINCVDNLLILLATLFAFKLKVLLANLTCLLQEAFRLN